MGIIEAAAIIGAAAAVGGTAHSVESSAQAGRMAGQEKNVKQAKLDDLEKKRKAKEAADAAQATALAAKDRQRQQFAGSGAGGRQGTILTSPLGLPGGYSGGGGGKTLLGS
ncbi:MAG: hypothetical protein H0W99_07510 [Acidobacteria bacterium]|nr:hypothetical protein [Acidobacteriota bacterium]